MINAILMIHRVKYMKMSSNAHDIKYPYLSTLRWTHFNLFAFCYIRPNACLDDAIIRDGSPFFSRFIYLSVIATTSRFDVFWTTLFWDFALFHLIFGFQLRIDFWTNFGTCLYIHLKMNISYVIHSFVD